MKRIFYALAAIAVASCGTPKKSASGQETQDAPAANDMITTLPAKSPKPVNADAPEAGRTAFALSLFNSALSESDDDASNVIVSPYSAGMALSMLSDGAAGDTKAELLSALCGSSYAGDVLKQGSGYSISSANSIWMRNGFEVLPAYRKTLEGSYKAMIAERDFSSPATVKEINKWCSSNTAGRIPEIIDAISPDMMMFIINALYFKAPWQYQFDKNSTYPEVFHSPSGDIKTDFMHISENFRCGENDACKYVILPYKSGDYKMAVLLPSEGTDIADLLASVSASDVDAAFSSATSRKVALSMPKFKVNTTLILNDILGKMGVRKAFGAGADFSGMTSSGVAVDQIRQKCFVEVNEEGSEAAAVTSVGVRLTSVRPESRPFIMRLDRPFVFAIMNSAANDILFAGRIAAPRL